MPVSVFSCSVASVGKLNLSATTLERPGSSAFDEIEISCDHEKEMLKGAEECSFRDARVDDEMGRSAERERFPALVVKRENEEGKKEKPVANSRRLPPEWPNGQQAIESAPRGKQKRMDGPGAASELQERRGNMQCKEASTLDLVPSPAVSRFFLETDRSVYSGRL
ncbi:hypothetical protein CFAM422_000438 [Trichoderma lentiforme]|uniref:Uncharacterized protein n=1 Tax=Trichoderma lentiforme TaxID=1567552 RepID=A0A9P4XRR2_9HYPO|nr:hypothetical protein CFAM422_000438 [Trichoderma lentiforme]